jgi:D-tyrosyl-tRNA(Tyr) deacylase
LSSKVSSASVTIEHKVVADSKGLVILVGIEDTDSEDIDWLVGKITKIRVFDDENQVMNLSVQDIDGEIIVVSQFTLHASTKRQSSFLYQSSKTRCCDSTL